MKIPTPRCRLVPYLAAIASLAVFASAQTAPGYRLLISGFQQGDLAVYDGLTLERVLSVPVRDRSGIIGTAIMSGGQKIFLADGDRLRVIDANTGGVLSETTYGGAQHLLGGGPLLHLMANDRFLLLKTYDLGAAAAGVRIFDVASGAFTGVGLRSRACPAPEFVSTHDGTLFAVCPGLIQSLKAAQSVAGDLPRGDETRTSLSEVAGAVISVQGDRIFAVDFLYPNKPWQLVIWKAGDANSRTEDLKTLLHLGSEVGRAGKQVAVAVSSDATHLALLHASHVWLLNSESLKVERSWDLPSAGSGLGFSPDASEVFTIDGEGLALWRLMIASGEVQRIPLPGLQPSRGPKTLIVAPAPSVEVRRAR